ncbi:alginate export family protein [Bacteroidota bacterium]
MLRIFLLCTFLLISLLPQFVNSQKLIDIAGQFRYRLEMSNRDFNKNTDCNNYSLLRSRIGLLYSPIKNIKAFFQLEDSRILSEGSDNFIPSISKHLNLFQAFLEFDSLFHIPLKLRLGRSEIEYSNERLIGAVGWRNVGRSFDGLNLEFESNSILINFFSFQIQENLKPGNVEDLNFTGIWGILNLYNNLESHFFTFWREEPGKNGLS